MGSWARSYFPTPAYLINLRIAVGGLKKMRISKRITQKVIAANRQNSRKSPGPQTATGKRRAGRNALKHGLYSKELNVSESERQEFETMRASLVGQLAPTTPVQEIAVDQVVCSTWRCKMAMRLETRRMAAHFERDDEPQATRSKENLEVTLEHKLSREWTRNNLRFLSNLRADVEEDGLFHQDVWRGDVAKRFGMDYCEALTAWPHTPMNEVHMARMLVYKNQQFHTPIPEGLLPPTDKELTEDANVRVAMVLKLIDLKAEHLKDLVNSYEDSDRALRPEPAESIARHFAAAARDLRRAVDWLLHLRAKKM